MTIIQRTPEKDAICAMTCASFRDNNMHSTLCPYTQDRWMKQSPTMHESDFEMPVRMVPSKS